MSYSLLLESGPARPEAARSGHRRMARWLLRPARESPPGCVGNVVRREAEIREPGRAVATEKAATSSECNPGMPAVGRGTARRVGDPFQWACRRRQVAEMKWSWIVPTLQRTCR